MLTLLLIPSTPGPPPAGTEYRIYGNDGAGGPIDYGTPLDQTSALTWDTSALAAGIHRFGVRAVDTASGLEESNVDAAVEIVIDAGLNDVSAVPAPPRGLAAVATAAGTAYVSWSWPVGEPTPTGFHVYAGTPGPDFGTPAATVAGFTGQRRYSATLSGLIEGTTYQVAVRAFNAVGEETNAVVVNITGSNLAPSNVTNLVAS